MYESIDPVPRGSRLTMSRNTLTQVGVRIAEHAASFGAERVRVVLHGGEPLLSGAAELAWAARELRRLVGPGVRLACTVQTNGLLLSESALDTLAAAGVRVGVSLDGGRATNDRHRLFRDGRSSYDGTVGALDRLRRRPDMYAGLLAVVDIESDPVETYEALLRHEPPAIDLLLPHGNWQEPPPHRPPDDSTPYGDWLVRVFDRWYSAPREETRVRLFDGIVRGLLGRASGCESIGRRSGVEVAVLDTDGAIEMVDVLRTAFPGARETGLNVFEHPFELAMSGAPGNARETLSDICLGCPILEVCGGGYHPHRYSAERGFRNPSVYCADLRRLIAHIGARVRPDLQGIVRQEHHADALSRQ